MNGVTDGGMTRSNDGISAVLFDLGGVLIEWDPRLLYRKLFNGDPKAIEWFLAEVCTPEWNAQQDGGRSFEEAVCERIALFPEHETLIRAYYDRWEEMIGGPIDGTVEILSELRSRPFQLFALTNWSSETFPVARERFEFLAWFKDIVVSGEIGLIKPGEEIFRHAIEKFGLVPEETVFVDDSGPNVRTAERMGFRAIQFQGPEHLRDQLASLDVIARP